VDNDPEETSITTGEFVVGVEELGLVHNGVILSLTHRFVKIPIGASFLGTLRHPPVPYSLGFDPHNTYIKPQGRRFVKTWGNTKPTYGKSFGTLVRIHSVK